MQSRAASKYCGEILNIDDKMFSDKTQYSPRYQARLISLTLVLIAYEVCGLIHKVFAHLIKDLFK